MNSTFKLLFVFAVVGFVAAAQSEEESQSELKAAGMSAAGLSGLATLSKKFEAEYPSVAGSEKAAEKFLAAFRKETQDFVKTLSAKDQEIYAEYKKKVEADD